MAASVEKMTNKDVLKEVANVLIGMDGIFYEKDYRRMCRLAKRLRAIADRKPIVKTLIDR